MKYETSTKRFKNRTVSASDQLLPGTELLTLWEVAAILRVTYARAAELARTGLIAGVVRLGRQVRVDPVALQAFISAGGRALPGTWRKEDSNVR